MSLFIQWPITVLLFIVFALFIFYFMTRNKKIMLKICSALAGISITGGFLIYSFSFLPANSNFADIPLAVLRGIINTTRMFFLNADYDVFASAIGAANLSDNYWPRIIYWVIHLMAMLVMQIAVISIFGKRVVDYFRLRFGRHNDVYIIKGSDKYAVLLGENIATHDDPKSNPDPKRLVVYLLNEEENPEKMREKTAHFGGIVIVLDRNQDFGYCLRRSGLRRPCIFIRKRNFKIILMPGLQSCRDDTKHIVDYSNKNKVNPASLDIYVFTSNEWDREKIEEMIQSEKDGIRDYPYTFHIINELELLIRQMVIKHPPYKSPMLGISEAKAAKNFTVLILGFGEVGQAALLRLIMNGQFYGSEMQAVVVDKNITDLSECFLHRYPSIKTCCNIRFEKIDVQCDSFYNLLNAIDGIDYVVVALNNNEINKQIALDLKLHYGRKDKNSLPFIAVSEKNGCMHEKHVNDKIFIFGCKEEIFREEVIIRTNLDKMAKAVNEVYTRPANPTDVYTGPAWHELEIFKQESNRASADFVPAHLFLAGLDADSAEKLHNSSETVKENLAKTEHLRWNAFHAAMGYEAMGLDLMRHRFEVKRQEVNPQSNDEKKDVLNFSRINAEAKQHICLVDWEELDHVTTEYNKLEINLGKSENEVQNFKNNDRNIVINIPKFIDEAKNRK